MAIDYAGKGAVNLQDAVRDLDERLKKLEAPKPPVAPPPAPPAPPKPSTV
jgi:hypothetical protein